MPDLAEYQELLLRKKAEKAVHVHEQRTLIIPRALDISHKAQQVVDSPGWQWYADAIESRVAEVAGKRAAKSEEMVHGVAMGHELELLKIELNVMDAEVAGLKYAQSLIARAVEIGQEVAGAATSVA